MVKSFIEYEKEKKREARQIEYIEFTKNCGDCGRRFKDKFPIFSSFKEYIKLVKFYWEKDSVACPKCSQRHYVEDLKNNRLTKKGTIKKK